MPPLLFWLVRATAIMVRMNAEKGSVMRRFFSIWAYITLASPRMFCVSMSV